MVKIRLLGGVDAATDDGQPLDVGPAKCQALLAALALSPGMAVPVARLVELVWGLDPPRTAEKTLQSYVTRLRKGLGPDAIERTGAAYRLTVHPQSVDVARFQRLIDTGDIDAALQQWTGPPLAGIDAPGLTGVVDSLIEQWLGAVEVDLGQRVDRDPQSTVGELTELTSDHPFREGLWALLMTALYRTGRQADALAAYRRAREHLVEELGVEPGPRLRELEALVLGHDDRLDAGSARPTAGAAIPTGTVTFGFSDIEGSSRLWAEERQRMSGAVSRHDDIVRACSADHGGHIFATGGDSFGVAFSRVGDATRWATDVQATIGAETWPEDTEIRVRIGLHTGEAEERADDYFGPAVNIAARIAAAGHGGQTLISHVTASLLDDRLPLDLGRFRFDGVGVELRVFQLDDGDHPPLRIEETGRGNLPRRHQRLFGRDDEVVALGASLRSHPIVTLVGPGGIGKTSLAVAAARLAAVDLDDGAWLIELADLASSDDVARTVADVLDVTESPRQTVTESLVAHLDARRALLVLDNCEHVVDGVAELVASVATACPEVTVLATSREGLGLSDEQLIVVGPLDPEGPAVELFAERARAADPGFDLAADSEAVTEICRRLDGVPLAIELAAARVRSLTPSDLVERLEDRLRLLTGGRRRSVERHRTLRATIRWSYDLLTPAEQVLFRRLSIFSGSFDLAAAEAVTADDELPGNDVNRLLSDLVERSMVAVVAGEYGRRFRLLETMRQFAGEDLAEAGASHRLARRHAAFVLDEITRIGAMLMSNDEIEGAARLEELWPNVRAATDFSLTIGDRELATGLIRPVALQMFARRGLAEIADWAERLLAITPPDDTETAAWCLLWASMHYSTTQRRDQFRRLIDRSGAGDHLFARYAFIIGVEDNNFAALELGPLVIDEMRRRGHDEYARLFEVFTGAALLTAGHSDQAREKHMALADRLRSDGPPSFLNWTLWLLGAAAAFEGDHEQADRYWDECASIEVPPRTNSPNEMLSARTAFRRGRKQEAYEILQSYIDELIEEDNMSGVAMVAIEFINVMSAVGRLSDAAVVLGHLEASGLLGVEGPGFKALVAESLELVAADAEAVAAQQDAAARGLDGRDALAHMRSVLDQM